MFFGEGCKNKKNPQTLKNKIRWNEKVPRIFVVLLAIKLQFKLKKICLT